MTSATRPMYSIRTEILRAIVALSMVVVLVGCRPTSPLSSSASNEQQSPELEPLSVEARELAVSEIDKRIKEGDFSGADARLRPLLALEPTHPPLLFLAAQCSRGRGHLDDAIETLELIPVDHPEAGLAALGQGADWLAESGRLLEAEARFKKMLELRNNLAPVHRRLAELLNSQGRRVEAAYHIRQLIHIGDVTEKELLSLTTLSVPFHDETTEQDSSSRLQLLARAKRLFVQGKVQASLEIAEQLRNEFPNSTATAAFLGRVYDNLQLDDKLAQWAKSLPQGIESESEYWTAVGQWTFRTGRAEVAVRCFCEAVSRDSTDRIAYLRLAESLAKSGQSELADRAAARQELLLQAWQLAINIGLARKSRLDDIELLATKLDELQRPWEAVSWRFIAAHDRNQLEKVLPSLVQRRKMLATQNALEESNEANQFLICNVKLNDWPLPDLNVTPSKTPRFRPEVVLADERNNHSIVLVDMAAKLGIDFQYHNSQSTNAAQLMMYQTAGGGIAAFDFDLDGWTDLYFSQAGGPPNDARGSEPNRLYRNIAGESFIDVGQFTGTDDRSYGQGVAAADLNQDGFVDLAVANIGTNIVFTNNGDGTFTGNPIADSNGWSTSIACGDLDGDHLPELVEINYINDPAAFTTKCWGDKFDCTPRIFQPAKNRIIRRDRDGRWIPWKWNHDFNDFPNFGFAGIIANFDQQGGNDLFVANDTRDNHFWISREADDKDAFELANQAQLRGCAVGANGDQQGSMGIASGDFDRDGTLDLYVTNFWEQASNLYLQHSQGFFVDYAMQYGLTEPSRPTVGFGTQASDLDRDGWLDLTVLNGHVFDPAENGTPEIPFRMTPQLFRGGPEGFMVEKPSGETIDFWSHPTLGRTLATIDFNNDGRPDLVANHLDAPVALLENRTQGGRWLRLDLVGTTSERDSIGAKVVVKDGNETWTAWVVGGDGYLCTNESTIDIGVGKLLAIETVEIFWPSGMHQAFNDVATNQSYLLIESDDRIFPR